MDVQVFHARSRGLSEIDSYVIPVRNQACRENSDRQFQKTKKVCDLLGLKRLQIGTVSPWNDHEVAIVVRESVHHDERVFSSMEDEMFFISLLSRDLTEETPAFLLSPDIGHPPGGPNLFHLSSVVVKSMRKPHRIKTLFVKLHALKGVASR
jgi:hypothetical protein